MPYGLSNDTVARIHSVFARHPEVQQAILYGSRAMGTQRDGSDIDLTLTGKDLDFKRLARIETELDDLLLPYKLDLSIRRQIDNDALLNHIERVGVLFYDRERKGAGQDGEGSDAAKKKGWETKKLGEVCDMYQPKTISKKEMVEDGTYPVYGANGVIGRYSQFNHEEPQLLVTCRGATCGSVNISAPYSWINGNAMVVRPKNELVKMRFMEYLFRGGINISKAITGAAQPQITRTTLASLEASFPKSLAEQQRIVGLLDEAFKSLAIAKANAEKNLQNARALFESHLHSVFTQRGPGWVEKRLDEVCEKITDGTHHSPKTQLSERLPGTFPYITSKNIRNNFMDLSKMVFVERAFHDEVYARCNPGLGDVLITKDGANTGNVTLNTIDEPFSLLSSVCLIKTNQAVLKPAFLCFYLQSSTGLHVILGQMTGAAIKRIVLKDIKKAVIPYPPFKEQEIIVETFNSLLAETQGLTRIYERKLAALEELKQSLLHQAFTGEL